MTYFSFRRSKILLAGWCGGEEQIYFGLRHHPLHGIGGQKDF
jgi:hypothetical protein